MLNFDRSNMVLGIFKMISTSGFLTALECTKFVFGRGSASDPTGGALSALPGPLAGLRGPTSKGQGRGGRGKGDGRDRPPFRRFLDPPPNLTCNSNSLYQLITGNLGGASARHTLLPLLLRFGCVTC